MHSRRGSCQLCTTEVTETLAQAGTLADLSQLVAFGDGFLGIDWQGVSQQLRLQLGTYRGTTVAVPLDGSLLVQLYRRDVLQALELTVPRTWRALLELVSGYSGWRAAASSGPTTSTSGAVLPPYALCLPTGASCQQPLVGLLQAIWASLAQMRGSQQGVHFDTTTFEPLLDSPAALEAFAVLAELLAAAAPPEPEEAGTGGAGCSDGSLGFARGRCAMTLGMLAPQMRFFLDPSFRATVAQSLVGVAAAPLSHLVWQRHGAALPASVGSTSSTGSDSGGAVNGLAQCSPSSCPYAVRLEGAVAEGGALLANTAPQSSPMLLVGGVSARTSESLQLLSYVLLKHLSSPDRYGDVNSSAYGSAALASTSPARPFFRTAQRADVWVAAGYDVDLVNEALPVLTHMDGHPNTAWGLRMASSAYYQSLLGNITSRLLSGAIVSDVEPASMRQPLQPLPSPVVQAEAATPDPGAVAGSGVTASEPETARRRGLRADGGAAGVQPLTAALVEAKAAAAAYYTREAYHELYLISLTASDAVVIHSAPPPPPASDAGSSGPSVATIAAASVAAVVGAVGLVAVAFAFVLSNSRCRAVLWRRWVRRRRRRAFQDFSVSGHRQVRAPEVSEQTALLVTDIESSTRLWEELDAEVMSAAVHLHHTCIRRLVVEHKGYESATEGDSFILAFRSVKQAVAFAVDLQAQLLVLPWPQPLLHDEIAAPLYTDLPEGFPFVHRSGTGGSDDGAGAAAGQSTGGEDGGLSAATPTSPGGTGLSGETHPAATAAELLPSALRHLRGMGRSAASVLSGVGSSGPPTPSALSLTYAMLSGHRTTTLLGETMPAPSGDSGFGGHSALSRFKATAASTPRSLSAAVLHYGRPRTPQPSAMRAASGRHDGAGVGGGGGGGGSRGGGAGVGFWASAWLGRRSPPLRSPAPSGAEGAAAAGPSAAALIEALASTGSSGGGGRGLWRNFSARGGLGRCSAPLSAKAAARHPQPVRLSTASPFSPSAARSAAATAAAAAAMSGSGQQDFAHAALTTAESDLEDGRRTVLVGAFPPNMRPPAITIPKTDGDDADMAEAPCQEAGALAGYGDPCFCVRRYTSHLTDSDSEACLARAHQTLVPVTVTQVRLPAGLTLGNGGGAAQSGVGLGGHTEEGEQEGDGDDGSTCDSNVVEAVFPTDHADEPLVGSLHASAAAAAAAGAASQRQRRSLSLARGGGTGSPAPDGVERRRSHNGIWPGILTPHRAAAAGTRIGAQHGGGSPRHALGGGAGTASALHPDGGTAVSLLAALEAVGSRLAPPPPGKTLGQVLRDIRAPSFPWEHSDGRARRLLIFRGLRVRVGIHAGVASDAEMQYNAASARITYSGACVATCKAVADMAHGGQIFLSGAAKEQLAEAMHRHNGGRPYNSLMLHMGMYMKDAQPSQPPANLLCTDPAGFERVATPRRQALSRNASHTVLSRGVSRQLTGGPLLSGASNVLTAAGGCSTAGTFQACTAAGGPVGCSPVGGGISIETLDREVGACMPLPSSPRSAQSVFRQLPESLQLFAGPCPIAASAGGASTPHALSGTLGMVADEAAAGAAMPSPLLTCPSTSRHQPALHLVSGNSAQLSRCMTGMATGLTPAHQHELQQPTAQAGPAPETLSVFWLTSPALSQRLVLVPPPRLKADLAPLQDVLEAPVGRVSYVVVQVPAASTLLAWNRDVAGEALRLFREAAAAQLREVQGGYLCSSPHEGELCAAFNTASAAVRWAEGLRRQLLDADWPEELLAHELCEVVDVSDSDESDSETEADMFGEPCSGSRLTPCPSLSRASAGAAGAAAAAAAAAAARRRTSADFQVLHHHHHRHHGHHRHLWGSHHHHHHHHAHGKDPHQHSHSNHSGQPHGSHSHHASLLHVSSSQSLHSTHSHHSHHRTAHDSYGQGSASQHRPSSHSASLHAANSGLASASGATGIRPSSNLSVKLDAGHPVGGLTAWITSRLDRAAAGQAAILGTPSRRGLGLACPASGNSPPGTPTAGAPASNGSPGPFGASVASPFAQLLDVAGPAAALCATQAPLAQPAPALTMSQAAAAAFSHVPSRLGLMHGPPPAKTPVSDHGYLSAQSAGTPPAADVLWRQASGVTAPASAGAAMQRAPSRALMAQQLLAASSNDEEGAPWASSPVRAATPAAALGILPTAAAVAGAASGVLFGQGASLHAGRNARTHQAPASGGASSAAESACVGCAGVQNLSETGTAGPEMELGVAQSCGEPTAAGADAPAEDGETCDRDLGVEEDTAAEAVPAGAAVPGPSCAHPILGEARSRSLSIAVPRPSRAEPFSAHGGPSPRHPGVAAAACRGTSVEAELQHGGASSCFLAKSPAGLSLERERNSPFSTSMQTQLYGESARGSGASGAGGGGGAEGPEDQGPGEERDADGMGSLPGGMLRLQPVLRHASRSLDEILPQRAPPWGVPGEQATAGAAALYETSDIARPRRVLLRGLRLRAGISTGRVSWFVQDHTHDLGYAGKAVRTAARLAHDVAVSGQVLCDLATCQEAVVAQAAAAAAAAAERNAAMPPNASSSATVCAGGEGGRGAKLLLAFSPLYPADLAAVGGRKYKSTVFVCGFIPAEDVSLHTPGGRGAPASQHSFNCQGPPVDGRRCGAPPPPSPNPYLSAPLPCFAAPPGSAQLGGWQDPAAVGRAAAMSPPSSARPTLAGFLETTRPTHSTPLFKVNEMPAAEGDSGSSGDGDGDGDGSAHKSASAIRASNGGGAVGGNGGSTSGGLLGLLPRFPTSVALFAKSPVGSQHPATQRRSGAGASAAATGSTPLAVSSSASGALGSAGSPSSKRSAAITAPGSLPRGQQRQRTSPGFVSALLGGASSQAGAGSPTASHPGSGLLGSPTSPLGLGPHGRSGSRFRQVTRSGDGMLRGSVTLGEGGPHRIRQPSGPGVLVPPAAALAAMQGSGSPLRLPAGADVSDTPPGGSPTQQPPLAPSPTPPTPYLPRTHLLQPRAAPTRQPPGHPPFLHVQLQLHGRAPPASPVVQAQSLPPQAQRLGPVSASSVTPTPLQTPTHLLTPTCSHASPSEGSEGSAHFQPQPANLRPACPVHSSRLQGWGSDEQAPAALQPRGQPHHRLGLEAGAVAAPEEASSSALLPPLSEAGSNLASLADAEELTAEPCEGRADGGERRASAPVAASGHLTADLLTPPPALLSSGASSSSEDGVAASAAGAQGARRPHTSPSAVIQASAPGPAVPSGNRAPQHGVQRPGGVQAGARDGASLDLRSADGGGAETAAPEAPAPPLELVDPEAGSLEPQVLRAWTESHRASAEEPGRGPASAADGPMQAQRQRGGGGSGDGSVVHRARRRCIGSAGVVGAALSTPGGGSTGQLPVLRSAALRGWAGGRASGSDAGDQADGSAGPLASRLPSGVVLLEELTTVELPSLAPPSGNTTATVGSANGDPFTTAVSLPDQRSRCSRVRASVASGAASEGHEAAEEEPEVTARMLITPINACALQGGVAK
ncbi:hypothetical protein HYH03_016602 [Edaphochlamys debaryana]|uniref:Guanylate cyclase domain-containing protein n=1 Tax=Edaphochlamys debaryana TaxID=47281 RepID=A0A835XJL6_9CHLO|nr:hypothetical protein HYH03_016602 [Edaphochlamys debaryana]|eukprot:KAG2484649.1 hypothetical protein HYH03_016602 [Edaphochlamys debaryana]